MNPLISIITPTFNHENYIADTILSVLNQTYSNWEMIIFDDGSSDNTAQIIKGFSNKDKRIKYFYQENKGPLALPETYNKALEKSNGKFICILEGDDLWKPDKLNLQISAFATNSNIVLGWGRIKEFVNNKVTENTYPKNFQESKIPIYNNLKPASILELLFNDFPTPLTWMIKKEALINIGGFQKQEGYPAVDRPTLYRLSLEGIFFYDNSVLGYYRRTANQLTKTKMIELTLGSILNLKNFYTSLPNEIKKNLDISYKDIRKASEFAEVFSYFKNGRILSSQKKFELARTQFYQAIKKHPFGNLKWKFYSVLGYIFTLFKLDLEFLARITKSAKL